MGVRVWLNADQRKFVKAAMRYDLDADFIRRLRDGDVDFPFAWNRTCLMLDELERKHLAIVDHDRDGIPTMFYMTGDPMSYARDRRAEYAAAAPRFLGNRMTGAAGGLAVWFLQALFG